MILSYLQERYGNENSEVIFGFWNSYLKIEQLTCFMTSYGFITYKLQGDAALIYDMYLKPAFRGHTYAWKLHDHVLEKAEKAGKRVMLAFSDKLGQNHMAGIKAMKVAGFVPAHVTNNDYIFVKGI